jgi:pullulanase
MRKWLFNHIDFSTYPYYRGNDLGVFWSPQRTACKIWAPTAKEVWIRLYREGQGGKPFRKEALAPGGNGVWTVDLEGNLEGVFYAFKINDGIWLHETPDMYARCVGVNGKRGMVYDPGKTNPPEWENDRGPHCENTTGAVIYETHIRDFSIAESSGIQAKGKYAGFTEQGTQSPEGLATGLDHLLELGITHVHLMPVSDFYTVDEEDPLKKYNWGYDPLNFNAPEGSYSSDPYDGTVRIRELKELIQALHLKGIGVILDVVYNHTGRIRSSAFNQTVPGYFYRQNRDGTFANASGCGNELATERAMVRKYVVDSLKYWAEEFHIDGFRFDLMGIYDLKTMEIIREEMDRINPGMILYGEGWTAGMSPLDEKYRAVKHNLSKLSRIAAFNDDMRDALKGSWNAKKSRGFISGLTLHEESVKFGVVGAVWHPRIVYDYVTTSPAAWAGEPGQCINYVSCHDGYTLWDKLLRSNPEATDDERKKMVKLAGAVILTSQGVPFLHSGMEFCRTKNGETNSYKSPDAVNQINWSRKAEYADVFGYFNELIQLRKKHPAFRMADPEMIRKNLHFFDTYYPGVVAYSINGKEAKDPWSAILVILNGNNQATEVQLPEGKYTMITSGSVIHPEGSEPAVSGRLVAEAIAMTILVGDAS